MKPDSLHAELTFENVIICVFAHTVVPTTYALTAVKEVYSAVKRFKHNPDGYLF